MGRYPSLGRPFARAQPVQPWSNRRLQRQARRVAGNAGLCWGTPRSSTRFQQRQRSALLTIERLARIEVDFLDRLVHGCYRAFDRFDLLAALTMYYFVGAIHSEERRRQGRADERDESSSPMTCLSAKRSGTATRGC